MPDTSIYPVPPTYLYMVFNPELFADFGDEDEDPFVRLEKLKPYTLTYDGTTKDVRDIVTKFFIVIQKGEDILGPTPEWWDWRGDRYTTDRKPWEAIEIDPNDIQLEIKYDSRALSISNIPKNVGRYDFTISATYVRNIPQPSDPLADPVHKHNGTYRGFYSTYEDKPSIVPNQDADLFLDFSRFSAETGLERPKQGFVEIHKFLVIKPCPVDIIFNTTTFTYTGNTIVPEYTTNPQVLDTSDVNYPGNVPTRLMYGKLNEVTTTPLAPPIEIGSYTVSATIADLNYVGSKTQSIEVIPLSTTEAAARANEYQDKVDEFETSVSKTPKNNSLSSSSFASYSENVSTSDFIKSGVLTMIEKADIPALGTVKTLAECAQNLPQKLMIFAAAKVAQLVLSYVPGLGILKLLTSIMEVIEQVQKILALIEFIKDNPWAFLNSVLEATGVYDKIGTFANEQVEALKSQFPGITEGISDVAGFVKDVANGLVDICNAVDIHGNPISQYIKADNTKVPSAIAGFIPATSRQPSEAKGKYDLFQFRLRDALYKDNDKIAELKNEGNTAGLEEYVSMLTAVHELAYNYHDSVAATGSGSGLLSSSSTTADGLDSVYNILGQATNILSSVVPQTSSTAATSTTTSGSTQRSTFSVDSLNSGLTTAANAIGGVASSIGAVGSFLSGETGFSLVALKNEFNYFADDTLAKNPTWSPETVKEYKKRVNKIKYEIENNADAIRNNPANAGFAQASGTEAANSSSGSSPTSFLASAFKGSPLASSFLGK